MFAPSLMAQTGDANIELDPAGRGQLFVFRSDHFELYTDLEPRSTIAVLDRIERLASNLGSYFGRPLQGKIRCIVAQNPDNWPAELMRDGYGRQQIAEQSGAIVWERDGTADVPRPVVYAFADGATPQREVVRAFCLQTFGRTGPEWFADGLAEVGAYWNEDGRVHCPAWMADYLRNDTRTRPAEIIGNRLGHLEPWQVAAHRWALTYMLTTHPRYSARFRQLGLDYLSGREPEFSERFAELGGGMDADYRTFVAGLGLDRGAVAAAVGD